MNENTSIPGLPDDLVAALSEAIPKTDALEITDNHLENVAFHDFAVYEYIFDPWRGMETPLPELTEDEKALIDEYFQYVERYTEIELRSSGIYELFIFIRNTAVRTIIKLYGEEEAQAFMGHVNNLLYNFVIEGIPAIYEVYRTLDSVEQVKFQEDIKQGIQFWAYYNIGGAAGVHIPTFDERLNGPSSELHIPTIDELLNGPSFTDIDFDWLHLAEAYRGGNGSTNPYKSTAFPVNVIDIGLRLVYRQEWRSLGNQDGEIVRTIPLGPRQSEKISVKFMRRNKGTRQLEALTATETTRESSDTTKDSSEIVEEASKTKQWEVSGSAEFDIGFFSAGGGGGTTNESANSSKEAKTKLSETMQKTASKNET